METENIDVLVIGSGTAGSNAAKAAIKAGAETVVMVHTPNLINTCVEEGCMPSKSVLAGAHQGESHEQILNTRDAHVERLLGALTESWSNAEFEVLVGHAHFAEGGEVAVAAGDGHTHTYRTTSTIIATGSHSFIPPISGLNEETLGERLWLSDDLVSRHHHLKTVPKRVLTIGGGPIGLEMSTYLHDLGVQVDVLQRKQALGLFDPEFGQERLRASQDPSSFPIHLNCELKEAKPDGDQVLCLIEQDEQTRESHYDAILVATGRRPNLDNLGLEHTSIERDERGNIIHNEYMETAQPGIFIAGDVTGHHQILHFAAEMGKVAGHNAAIKEVEEKKIMDYDRHMLAVSFDQFPSALIGLTETEANKRGIETITATRYFNSIGLGILKRQEYGLWKVVAEKSTGEIIGSQVLGPDSSGELIQLLTPIIYNQNTASNIIDMTWYHPTYAEILLSIARDLNQSVSP